MLTTNFQQYSQIAATTMVSSLFNGPAKEDLMLRRSVSRSMALMILTLALALAGAAPAAAAQRSHAWSSPWSWMVSLWQAATGCPGPLPDTPGNPGGAGPGLDPDGR
jgi:hypothetical protein